MLTDGGGGGTSFEEDLDSVTPRSAPAGASEPPPPGGVGLGIHTVRLFGEPGPTPGVGGGGSSGAAGGDAALDFKLAAAVLRTGGGGGASGSDEDEVSEVESFILDQEDLDNPVLKTTSEIFLSSTAEGADLHTVDPETQARLEALLEAAGIGKLSTPDGKAFADPEVLRRLTSSVSCALDEAAAALTRMRAENSHNAGQVDTRSLAEACSDGDVNAVRKLLDEGRSVNEHTEEGESLLCLACSAGYYELAQVLLAMHANVEDRGNKGDITPLMAASSGGYLDIVKLLLLHDADVNSQSATGNTALTYACAGGFVDIVKVLLNEGANIEDHNENGHTPLMEAASAGHVEVARVLLDHGAGINTHSNEFKESALTLACYKGHLDMVRFLLEAGADQEHKTDEMHTALMEACMDGHVEVARLLLDSGAQVNMPADSFESPLTLAACGGHVELAALLIERGANLEEVNDEGYTPLMEAAREGHEEMVALLLAQGANINAQTEETQETALTLACCGGFSEVADFLIKAGADIELGCSTPLMEASQEGHLELVKYLLAAGANVHATTATGDTALTYACENGHTDVADVLLQAGADLEHESEGGRTPLMKAARAGHLCTVQFLISKGANVNRATANNDHTVVSLACAGGHLAVVELLLAHGADPTHRLKDGSTMLIEAAKGGHTNVVSYLLDYPNNVLSVPTTDISQLTPPSQDQSQVPRVPMHTLAMVVPPQEPDRTSQEYSPALIGVQKGTSKQKSSSLQVADQDLLPPFHPYQPLECIVEETEGKLNELGQRISAIEKAQLKSLELIQGEPLNKDKIEELKKNREEQVQKKKKILKELQKVERQLQMKTQQQFTKEYLETKGQKDTVSLHQQCSHRGVLPEGEGAGSLPEDHFSELPQVDTILFKDNNDDDEQQSSPSAEQIDFVPVQPLSPAQCNFASDLGSNGTNSLELQKLSGNQQIVGQPHIAITGHDQGLLVPEPDGLMVATPAQTLTDTLDDLIAAVSSRVPTGSNSSSQITECLTPESCSQTPSNMVPQPMPLVYPSVDIDAHTESNHDTALTLACAGGHEELVSVLIARDAKIEHRDKKGFTPLILAATAGHVGVVEILLDKGGDIEAQSERTKDTPLSLACSGGRQEVVDLLLARGANKEHRNVSDYTPLSLAASGGYVNIIKILLNAGAEINSRTGSKLGISPLMLAAMNGHVPAVKLLLDMGSDINAQIETNRNTALTLACFQGRAEVVSLLLDRKANVEHRAKTGLTPLMEAASGGYAEVGRVLLDKGADVNAPPVPSSRDTALTIAADKGHYKFCELLINRGAHIDVRNKKGNTPLWLASNGGHFDVVQLLVQAGADVDAADNRKITPLMSAFRKGHVKVVQYLVKEVNQFPSDIECMRYIATITDKELLKKCHQCVETIVKAKDQQAAEANKNASILLKELDLEKSSFYRSKKLSVPASVVSRIMGRGGCNITAIQDVTGAHIDVDKQKDKNGERMITIRGGTESTRYAVQLINALIQDPAKELEDLIPKNHIRTPASTKPIHANFSPGVGTTAASSKNAFPLGAPTLVTSQATTLSTFQPANKLNKNVPTNVRSSFPVSLPLAYPHPHFALLAAQTMQQIRHPRLPMAQFGGTFSPSPNTWGPFPVRPVNPGNTNSSPKHNNTTRLPNQNGTVLSSESPGLATASCPITVSSVVAASQQLCVTNTRTPSSVRKQLFACVPKTSPPASVISSVTSTCSPLPSVSSAPITSGQVPTTFLPVTTPQAQLSSQKMESFSAMPPPKEKVPTQDQPIPNLCTPSPTANGCSSSASNTPGAAETHPTSSSTPPSSNTQEEAQPSSVSDLSPMSMPFASNSEPVPLTLASPRFVTADNQDTSNLPQLAVPAPRVSHRMQARGSFYSVVPNAAIHQDPQSIFVTNPVPLTTPQGPPAAVQLSSAMNIMNGSQMHINPANKSLQPTFGPATLFNHFSSLFDSSQVPANQGWGDGPLSSRVAADASFTVQSAFLGNSVLGHLENVHPDSSKAPGFRSPSQRVSTSPVGLPSIDPSGSSPSSSSAPLSSFSGIPGTRVFLQGPAPVGTPSFNRQHFSPHPWTSTSNSCDSPIPSVSSGSSSPLSATSAPPTLGQPKGGSASQDRKIPPPIGTERLARIRQGGSVAQAPVGTSFVAPVGHSGIWSFGVNAVSEGLSGWSQSVIGNHPMHQQLSDPSTFSQHQPMERDDSGMVAPSNIFHQPIASGFVDFSKGLPISMYGGTIIPSHPQLADVPAGPLFNGLHGTDPGWNPMIKVIQNSTECTDAQQASLLSSVPGLKGEIPSPQLTRPKKRAGQPMVASPNQRHQDHLRQKVPAGMQELTHCSDTPLLPSSDSRCNNSNCSTLQAGVAEGTEGDRARDTR
nr:ankyrin repeat and KH domain-containing protein 1 [Cavia porcellus]